MVLSSSSLSEPPEELLSEAAGGTLLFASEAASVDEIKLERMLPGSFRAGSEGSPRVDTHCSRCGFDWLVCLRRCCPSPPESCTWARDLYWNRAQLTCFRV